MRSLQEIKWSMDVMLFRATLNLMRGKYALKKLDVLKKRNENLLRRDVK